MSNSSSERIENWLDQVSSVPLSLAPEPPSIPTNPQSRAGIRKKRAMSSSSRGISPAKRRRGDGGDSSQRASLASVSEPKLRSTTSTASRSSSPARDIFNQLRLSTPAIICEPQATGFLPEAVLSLRKRLTVGFGQGVIPEGLKGITQNKSCHNVKIVDLITFQSRILTTDPAGVDEIPEFAFYNSDVPESTLGSLWDEVERIRSQARDCDMYGKDENAWCLDVVQPILLAGLRGTSKLHLTSVQSQQIDPALLPIAKNSLARINKKTDSTFCFSCGDPEVFELYQQVSLGGHGYEIGPTTDAFTKRTILFSGVEVKSNDGGRQEALAQLAIWQTAHLEKIKQLRYFATDGDVDFSNRLLPIVGYTVVGHDWYTYTIYKSENGVHVIGPISMVQADTRTTYGILKLCDLGKRITQFAEEEYWPWIRNEILQPLASRDE